MYSITEDVDVLRSTFMHMFEQNIEEITNMLTHDFIVMNVQEDETIFGVVAHGRLIMSSLCGFHYGTKKIDYMLNMRVESDEVFSEFIRHTLQRYTETDNKYIEQPCTALQRVLVDVVDKNYERELKKHLKQKVEFVL